MTSPYELDKETSEALETRVINALNRDEVVKAIRKSLSYHCQMAIDQATDYLQDEYQLVIEDIVKGRAKRMVQELLKGNHEFAQFFALAARDTQYGVDKGKPFVYDPDGVRREIFNAFKDEIQHAEMIALQEETAHLREALKVEREIRNRW